MRAFVTEGEPAVRTGLRGIGRKLEGGRDGIIAGVDLNALPGEDSVEVVEVEERVVSLEEGFALEELALDAFGVSTGGEGLAMAVLLVARSARRGAGGAARML